MWIDDLNYQKLWIELNWIDYTPKNRWIEIDGKWIELNLNWDCDEFAQLWCAQAFHCYWMKINKFMLVKKDLLISISINQSIKTTKMIIKLNKWTWKKTDKFLINVYSIHTVWQEILTIIVVNNKYKKILLLYFQYMSAFPPI